MLINFRLVPSPLPLITGATISLSVIMAWLITLPSKLPDLAYILPLSVTIKGAFLTSPSLTLLAPAQKTILSPVAYSTPLVFTPA